jgi:hypothetical protein
MVVVDYLPQTTLSTDVVEHLSVEKHRERNRSLGITVSGQYHHLAQGTATAGGGKTVKSSVRYELLPPLELLASSGTIGRGSGVYFKLRPSRRTSLEGAREFVLVLRVASAWRGDLVHVHCEAMGRESDLFGSVERERVWGIQDFLVALYAEGDLQAKQAAQAYVLAEQELRDAVAAGRRRIKKLAYPRVSLKMGRIPTFSDPKVSKTWIEGFLARPERTDAASVQRYLPPDVQAALADYTTARERMQVLSSRETTLARFGVAGAE